MGWVAPQPQLDTVMVELFGPHQPGEGLSLYLLLLPLKTWGLDGSIELVCFLTTLAKDGIKIIKGRAVRDI